MFGLGEGLYRLGLFYSISSFWFVGVTQGAHLQETSMVGKEDPSWAKRQARTSLNFSTDSLFWLIMTGGLNIQSLHHICPVIGSSHLIDLYPEYKKICQKHGVNL